MFKMKVFLLKTCLLLTLLESVTSTNNTIVETKYGKVQGHVVTLNDSSQILSFLGVPYARAPSGNLRFQPPEEPLPWNTTKVADALGNVCLQPGTLVGYWHPNWTKYDEDCLNINIFTPYNNTKLLRPYPVLVYYHGGSYQYGSNINGPGHFYPPRGVVYVSANYRLGTLGFVTSGDSEARGNYGMLDQIQVLKFVKENIQNFGGDPSKVTIMGHSAGGGSVALHVLSPLSRGLFHQAVMLSGTDQNWWAWNPTDIAVNITRQLALKVHCPLESKRQMINCLREKPAAELILHPTNLTQYPGKLTLGYIPSVDGEGGFLPEAPLELRKKGEFANVTIMAGQGNKETSLRFRTLVDGIDYDNFTNIISTQVHRVVGHLGQRTADFVSNGFLFQYTAWPQKDDKELNRDKLIEYWDDWVYDFPTDQVLKFHVGIGGKAYQYISGYRSNLLDPEVYPPWTGVWHGYDIRFYDGRVILRLNPEVVEDMEYPKSVLPLTNQNDTEFCNYWIDLFANFVKTGNPTPSPVEAPGNNPPTKWPPFTKDQYNYIEVTNEAISIKQDFRQRNFAMWREYMPWLINRTNTNPENPICSTPSPPSSDTSSSKMNATLFSVLTLITIFIFIL